MPVDIGHLLEGDINELTSWIVGELSVDESDGLNDRLSRESLHALIDYLTCAVSSRSAGQLVNEWRTN